MAEELREALRLMGSADELVVLFLRNHYHTFLALTRDELRAFGAGISEELTEARLSGLKLPPFPRCPAGR